MSDQPADSDAQAKLAEIELRERTLVEQLPAIFYVDEIATDSTLFISPQVQTILGYSPEEWMADGGLFYKRLHPDDLERVMGVDDELQQLGGSGIVVEYRVYARDGRMVWVRDIANVVRDGSGNALWLQGILIDITEQKEAESQLSAAQEIQRALDVEKATSAKLRELEEIKDQFLAGVSHDLRTPITSILGFARTLEDASIDLSVEDKMDFVHRIVVNAQKLEGLVTDLLDIYRLNHGVLDVELVAVELGTLIATIVKHADYLERHDVEVDVEPLTLSVDGRKVARIVDNLLTNAAKHTPQGTKVWVRLVASQRDGAKGAEITVEDAGPGIPERERADLFEEFRTGALTRAEGSPGLGVGLSLVAQFAEMHGGRAWADEREGGGTAFYVFLPDGLRKDTG